MSLDPTLPIKLDSTSNGEYAPWPVGRTVTHAKQLAAERIATHAGRTGQSRRVFLTGLCGAATTLLAFNDAFAWRGHRGGSFELPREAAFEPAAALAAVGGREFIFDIQTHMVEADGAWRRERPQGMSWLAQTPQGRCGETDPLRCFDAPHFIKEVFLDSDTDSSSRSSTTAWVRTPTSMRSSARPGGWSCAIRPRPLTRSASCSSMRFQARPVGHGCHLVRLAPGPDPGLPDLPDQP